MTSNIESGKVLENIDCSQFAEDYLRLAGEKGKILEVRVEEEQNLPDSPDDAASSTGSGVGTGNFATAATLRPSQRGKLTLFENGDRVKNQHYHQVFSDGRYIYDPRLSQHPIPKGDWEKHIKNMNPEGVTISSNPRGL